MLNSADAEKSESMISSEDLSCLVLCGGQGSRLGHADKPLLEFNREGQSKPMVDHVLATLPKHTPTLISANRNHQRYAMRGKVVGDDECDLQVFGPLAGVYAALRQLDSPWLLVCPGDMPLLPQGWYEPLLATHPEQAALLHDGQCLQPLLCCLPQQASASLRRYLEEGKYSVKAWLKQIGAAVVPAHGSVTANARYYQNINSPEDWYRASP